MPTVIDSLVVLIGLDPSGYKKGSGAVREDIKKTRDQAGSAAKDMEAYGKRAASFFGSLRTEVVGLFLAFAGANGLKDFVQQVLTGEAATGRLAKNIGLSTNTLSAWQEAIKTVGGDAKDADSALRAMSDAFQQWQQTGQTGHDAQFLALLGPQYRAKIAEGPEATLLALAEASQHMDRRRFANLAGQIGLNDNAINLLEKGRAGVEQLVEWEKKHGAATEKDSQAAQHLQDTIAKLRSEITGGVRPALQKLADFLANNLPAAFDVANDKMAGFKENWATLVSMWHHISTGDFSGLMNDIKNDIGGDLGRFKRNVNIDREGQGPTGHMFGGLDGFLARGQAKAAEASAASSVGGDFAAVKGKILARESGGDYNAQAYNTRGGGNAAGLSQQNLTGMTIGQVLDYQRNTMRAKTRGKRGPGDVGSTGVGGYQFESGTLEQQARALFGANWRNVVFSASNQDRLAEHLYNSVKGSPSRLASTWAAFSAGASRYAGGGAGGSSTSTASTTIGTINIYTASNDANGIARDLSGAIKKRSMVTQANSGLSG